MFHRVSEIRVLTGQTMTNEFSTWLHTAHRIQLGTSKVYHKSTVEMVFIVIIGYSECLTRIVLASGEETEIMV
jgi:hypothetical protein